MSIYFDNSATTRIIPEVAETINRIFTENYGNPSSVHSMGFSAEEERERSRRTIADSINAKPGEIIFTSGGTESNNLGIIGYLKRNPRAGGKIITDTSEHASVSNVFSYLEGEGYNVVRIPVNPDGLDIERLISEVDQDTALVSIMAVNNESGLIFDVENIAAAVKKKNSGTVFHSDCVQAYMKIPLDMKKSNIDMISVSSHKINGPKGSGALYKKENIRISPIIHGGGQEGNLRSGTENLPGICGFAAAAEFHKKHFKENTDKIKEVKEKITGLVKNIDGVVINTPEISAPHILNISFPGAKSEITVHTLESRGIYVSGGSACASNFKDKENALSRMGYDKKIYDSSVRLSFSFENTVEEAEAAVRVMREKIPKIRAKR